MGVVSVLRGVCGIGESAESRTPEAARGIIGVRRGEERTEGGAIVGATAGIMLVDETMVLDFDICGERRAGSEGDRACVRSGGEEDEMSMWWGALGLCERWLCPSVLAESRLRFVAARCWSLMKCRKRFLSTHFPTFTITRKLSSVHEHNTETDTRKGTHSSPRR